MTLKHRIHRLLSNLRQRSYRLFWVIIACLAALFGLNPSANADILRVDGTNGTCAGDGSGWNTNAFKYLQDALDAAVAGDRIWVAATDPENRYRPDQDCANPDGTGDRDATYQLVEGVTLLGGFDGTETLPEQRDAAVNITVLSGAIAQGQDPPGCAANMESCFEEPHDPGCFFDIDPRCCERVCLDDPLCCLPVEFGGEWNDNCVRLALELCGGSYHVVTAGGEIDDPEQTVIDGFTIRDGWANGPGFLEDQGGGMLIKGEPSVVRCTFTNNTASVRGGRGDGKKTSQVAQDSGKTGVYKGGRAGIRASSQQGAEEGTWARRHK